jgi:hypothetical protein
MMPNPAVERTSRALRHGATIAKFIGDAIPTS